MARCNRANNRDRGTAAQLPRRGRAIATASALLALTLSLYGPLALALKSDKDQQMFVDADYARSEGDKEVNVKKTIFLRGGVVTKQGTVKAHGDDAIVYMDKDPTLAVGAPGADKSKTQRLILTGKLAHMEQMQDNDGGLMTGDAEKLDYKLNEHIVEMTGNVTVVQEKQGTYRGEHMFYNTLTGEMTSGEMVNGSTAASQPTPNSRIHLVLQPKDEKGEPKPTAVIKPATPVTAAAAAAAAAATGKKNKTKDTTRTPTAPPPPAATTGNPDGH